MEHHPEPAFSGADTHDLSESSEPKKTMNRLPPIIPTVVILIPSAISTWLSTRQSSI
jgi:hypothetical protein